MFIETNIEKVYMRMNIFTVQEVYLAGFDFNFIRNTLKPVRYIFCTVKICILIHKFLPEVCWVKICSM